MKRHSHKKPRLPRPTKATISKLAAINRHIIAEGVEGNREYALHATKGYRATRA